MNKFLKKILDKLNKKFKEELERQKKFFKKPDVLVSLSITALVLLDKFRKERTSEKELKDFLRTNSVAKSIITYTSTVFNEDNLSELLLACLDNNENLIPELPENISESDLILLIDKDNDIDKKINYDKLHKLNLKFMNNTEIILVYTSLFYYVINLSKDLLTKTEFPSKYRTKYVQKLLRNLYGLIKIEVNSFETTRKKELENILDSLKQIDNILIAITLVSTIYILNRTKLQKLSRKTLQEISSDVICTDIPEAFDVSINRVPFEVTLSCPDIIDDVIVPHTPIELKLKELSCEITQNEEIIIDATESLDLTTYALIRNNKSKEILTPLVSKNSYVTQNLQIANLGNKVMYSPVNGYVDELNSNEIVIREISESDEDYLIMQINLFNTKYERFNNIKSFLKYYHVETLYPLMLATSIVDDSSTYDSMSGIEKQWKSIKKDFERIDKEYEKQIKKITGKNNVEKHAKNETLYEIKEQLEKQEEIFYSYVKLFKESAINIAKKTKAKSNEYELFEYYTLDLGAIFNGLENPSPLEIEFRDKINEFIRKRLIIDEYKKNKLENKINSQIKDIESGISLGNWFNKAMDIFKQHKKLSDVKTWLLGLANKNNKLESYEKIIYVNRVMFLLELYLNYDKLVEKYKILKKETTLKKETEKEGNYIIKFIENLWIEMESIPKEIKEIEKLIDSLKLFQTYSIIDWDGYKTRLYSLTDKPKCESKESNPYLNSKSQYGYDDIEYWLKYCAFATLASVTNPATGWSTGWIIPTPILFPVVYIPIKSITTKYGFIVIGISICGIWIFPWTLLVNLSSNHNTPIGNPAAAIKRKIDQLKITIAEQIQNLRKEYIKKLIDETDKKIKDIEFELKQQKQELILHKENKPSKYSKSNDNIKNGVHKNINYISEFAEWIEIKTILQEKLLSIKIKKWELEKIHKILTEAYKLGKSVKGSGKALEDTEKLVNKQLDKLTSLVDKIDDILAPLPITMKPETANFGITLKNIKPIIKITEDLDDNINENSLNKISDKFRLKNEDLVSSKYTNKISNSILNFKSYKNALSTNMVIIVKKDAFPSYELLKMTNIPWVSFLYKDFVTKGAQTYGWPGQIPLPI